MRKRKLNLAIKLIIIAIIIFLGLLFILRNLARLLRSSDYFRIKDIISNEENITEFSYLKGKNIFTVDLQNESRDILELYPNYRKIRLYRVLPNRLFVDFIIRTPLGFVKLYRYFCVDEDGVMFDVPGQLGRLDLPLILGLETKILAPIPGKKYNLNELSLALDIIKTISKNKSLRDCKIKMIKVANPNDASFFILFASQLLNYPKGQIVKGSEVLEIKIGQDGIEDRINTLGSLLIQLKNDLRNIKYIDLRFKEPVIKLNDGKS